MKRIHKHGLLVLAAALAIVPLLNSCAVNPEKAKLNYLDRGKAYMDKHQYSSAAIEFRNALKIDPKYVDAYYQLAKADLAQGDGSGAYSALNSALQIDPTRTDALLLRGRIYLAAASQQKDPRYLPKAEADANSILKQEPQNADAHELLASALAGEKKYDEASQEFATAIKLEPTKATPYMELGVLQMATNKPADAEQSFKKAVEVEPKNDQTYLNLANFYRLQKNTAQAESVLQQGAQNIPGDIRIYLDWAATLAFEGKTADADATLKVLRDQSPKSVDVASAIGDYYLERKKYDQALAEYQRGLSIDSKSLPLQQKVEDIYLTTGQIDRAAEIDAAVLKQAPNDVTNRINDGRLLLAQGKTQDAVRVLQKLVADAANSSEAHYYLGMAYWKSGDTGQANTEFQNALRITPGLPIALQALTDLNIAERNFSVAQIYAQELVQQNPGDPRNHLVLGEFLLQQGKIKDAEDQFMAAKQLAPNDPAVHVDLALLYQDEKKFSEADKEYQIAMQVAPQDNTSLERYAGYLISQGQQAKALTTIQQFIARNPKDAGAHLLLSSIQLQAKNYTVARSEAERALQLDPSSIAAYLQLGQVLGAQGDNAGALQAYQKALTMQPNSAVLITQIGNIYMNQGDLAKAASEFQKALAIDPNFAVAQNNLAWVYAEQGQNLDIALGLAQKAKAQDPRMVSFTDTLAWVLYQKKDYSGAIPYLQDCVKKSPNMGQYRYHLGMALVAAGQKQQGKAVLQAALKMNLDPADSQRAREALSREN
jgi:Tfp pilus assembly protein PilF